MKVRSVVTAVAGGVLAGAVAGAQELPFERTEVREPCAADRYEELRQPFFGDTHVHSSYSIDAFVFDVRNDPDDAYAFAKGLPVPLTPLVDGEFTRTAQLTRPLDFAAVTDHAEGFDIANICLNGLPGSDSVECQIFRSETPVPSRATLIALIATVGTVRPLKFPMCSLPDVDCEQASFDLWVDTQRAAEDAYDRNSDECGFTSFVAYEWTPMPLTANLHRNVIFRNERVPERPIDYFATETWEATRLWELLRYECLGRDGGELGETTGCDVLTIPHNSNLSAGMMFPDPADADEARERAFFEPLAEIIQHKQSSECRFDPLYGMGTDTTDEDCAFEKNDALTLLPVPGGTGIAPPPQTFPRRSYLRSVLQDGIALEAKLGVNPFKLGFVGSTDTHNGTPGNTEEATWPGHAGNQDDAPEKIVADMGIGSTNPGGLAVVWAEENSRDSIFAAMRRREAYGTSGTRPIVRFFGGWDYEAASLCSGDARAAIETAYARGVPMGADLPLAPANDAAPTFFISAMKDADSADLHRVQVVKGWVDAKGNTHEEVHDVFPETPTDPSLADAAGCAPAPGIADLCTVWTDPEFDPAEGAVYYARVLENETCRWSTYQCRALGIDPFATDCLAHAIRPGPPPQNLSACCRLPPTVQERAWTSPIWYSPPAS